MGNHRLGHLSGAALACVFALTAAAAEAQTASSAKPAAPAAKPAAPVAPAPVAAPAKPAAPIAPLKQPEKKPAEKKTELPSWLKKKDEKKEEKREARKEEKKAEKKAELPPWLKAAEEKKKEEAAKKAAAELAKKKEEAKNAFVDGKKLFEEGSAKKDQKKLADALEHFKKADALVPGALPKFFMAQCYEKLGKPGEAVAEYKAFLALNPSGKAAESVPEAKAHLDAIQATMPSRLRILVSPPNAADVHITVDNAPARGPELALKAGQHTVVVTATGMQPHTELVTLKGDEQRDLLVALQPIPVVVPPPPPHKPPPAEVAEKHSNVPAYVTLGIAGAGAVLGAAFGALALQAKSAFNATPTEDNAQKAERDALVSDMSFGVALTFGITGAVLLFSGGDEADEKPAEKAYLRPHLAPYAGPHGGGMAATWSF